MLNITKIFTLGKIFFYFSQEGIGENGHDDKKRDKEKGFTTQINQRTE